MRAVNHTVTGAVIVAALPHPLVSLPLALLSHLVLDALPHYGGEDTKSRSFLYTLALDAALAASFLLSIVVLAPSGWVWMVVGGVLAASPDLLWLPAWIKSLQGQDTQPGPLSKFLSWIQWCERPWGIFIELLWLPLMLVLFFRLTV